ncbi:MAG TPA: hypothetical protein VJJ98_04035 [Sedimentisphaerales bacterium]|nr:hypothetical protein [Sedimentisphaerales bacterium]
MKCGWVRYEVTPNDTPDSIMALMIDNAFDAGQVKEKSFDGTKRTAEQWRSFHLNSSGLLLRWCCDA